MNTTAIENRIEKLEKLADPFSDLPNEIRVHFIRPLQPGGPAREEAGIITIPVQRPA